MKRTLTVIGVTATVTGTLTLGIGAAAGSYEGVVDARGTVHACIDPTGHLRVGGSYACKDGETPITWSQSGSPDAQDPPEPAGTARAADAAGATGKGDATAVGDKGDKGNTHLTGAQRRPSGESVLAYAELRKPVQLPFGQIVDFGSGEQPDRHLLVRSAPFPVAKPALVQLLAHARSNVSTDAMCDGQTSDYGSGFMYLDNQFVNGLATLDFGLGTIRGGNESLYLEPGTHTVALYFETTGYQKSRAGTQTVDQVVVEVISHQ